MYDAQTCACIIIIIIIIILRLRSSRPQVSSIDGGLEPSPTGDCHLADYQDTQKTMNIIGDKVRCLPGFFLPWVGTYITKSLTGSFSGKRSTWPRNLSCRSLTLSIRGGWFCEAVDYSIWHPVDSPDVQHDSVAGRAKRIDFVLHVLRDDPWLGAI